MTPSLLEGGLCGQEEQSGPSGHLVSACQSGVYFLGHAAYVIVGGKYVTLTLFSTDSSCIVKKRPQLLHISALAMGLGILDIYHSLRCFMHRISLSAEPIPVFSL